MFFKIITHFIGKHLYRNLLWQSWSPQKCNFIKKRLQHRLFPVKVAKFLKLNSHSSKKICFNYFNESPLNMVKNALYFILKVLFVLNIFLSWLFGYVEKTTWLEIWLTNNYNPYCPISHEAKATRQWNLVSQ